MGADACSAVAQEQRDSMAKAWLHLLHRELSRGWVSWRAQWLESYASASAQRSVKRWMHQQLSGGWNAWAAMATERRRRWS